MRRQRRYLDTTVMIWTRRLAGPPLGRFGNFRECFRDLNLGQRNATLEECEARQSLSAKSRAQRARLIIEPNFSIAEINDTFHLRSPRPPADTEDSVEYFA